MNSENINLLFTGISALGALLSGLAAFKARGTKKEMEVTIDKLKNHIKSVNDLVFLEPQVGQISNMAQKFRTISSGVLPNTRGSKTERDYYIDLKSDISKILENIPSEYETIRSLLSSIIDAFSSCINDNKLFKDLDRDNIYSYEYVEKKYQDVLAELNNIIRDIKYLNVNDWITY